MMKMVMTKSLKNVIAILSIVIAILVLMVVDIADIIDYKNLAIGIIVHLVLVAGVTQCFYLGSMAIATLMTKWVLWRNASKVAKSRQDIEVKTLNKKELDKIDKIFIHNTGKSEVSDETKNIKS